MNESTHQDILIFIPDDDNRSLDESISFDVYTKENAIQEISYDNYPKGVVNTTSFESTIGIEINDY